MNEEEGSQLEKRVKDNEPSLFVDYGRGLLDLLGMLGPPPRIIARIRFLNEKDQFRGSEVLAKSGGYARYGHDSILYGIVSKKQLRKLRFRFIKYEFVDYL